MCRGIPMQVISTDEYSALCSGMGEQRLVSTLLLQEVRQGAWLLVAGQTAHAVLDEHEAQEITALLLQLDQLEQPWP